MTTNRQTNDADVVAISQSGAVTVCTVRSMIPMTTELDDDDINPSEGAAIRLWKQKGVILPGYARTVTKWRAANREDSK